MIVLGSSCVRAVVVKPEVQFDNKKKGQFGSNNQSKYWKHGKFENRAELY